MGVLIKIIAFCFAFAIGSIFVILFKWLFFNAGADLRISLDTLLFLKENETDRYSVGFRHGYIQIEIETVEYAKQIYTYDTYNPAYRSINISQNQDMKLQFKRVYVGLNLPDYIKYKRYLREKEKQAEKQKAFKKRKECIELIQACLDDIKRQVGEEN